MEKKDVIVYLKIYSVQTVVDKRTCKGNDITMWETNTNTNNRSLAKISLVSQKRTLTKYDFQKPCAASTRFRFRFGKTATTNSIRSDIDRSGEFRENDLRNTI